MYTQYTHIGIQIGCRIHRRVLSSSLNEGPASRRGKRVPVRSRCVCCYARAIVPEGGGRKTKMLNGDAIPNVTYACDVCREPLCKNCFQSGYDHRKRGKPSDFVTLR